MSRKVFTAGEVLAAADVNNFLMNQTVMSFAGTASRAASIPTPIEGMYTNLEDTDRLEFWNGSAWVSPLGFTPIVNTNFTGVTAINVDNVFTSQFEDYRIHLRVDSIASGTTVSFQMQFRKAGSNIGSANYFGIGFAADTVGGSTLVLDRANGAVSMTVLRAGKTGSSAHLSMDLTTPNISTRDTGYRYHAYSTYASGAPSTGTNLWSNGSGAYMANDNFDGISFIPGPVVGVTGNIKIYGYRN